MWPFSAAELLLHPLHIDMRRRGSMPAGWDDAGASAGAEVAAGAEAAVRLKDNAGVEAGAAVDGAAGASAGALAATELAADVAMLGNAKPPTPAPKQGSVSMCP